MDLRRIGCKSVNWNEDWIQGLLRRVRKCLLYKKEFLDHDDSFPDQAFPCLVGKLKIYYLLCNSSSQVHVYLARHPFPQERQFLANVSEDYPLLLMFSNKFLFAYHIFVIWATVFSCFLVFLLQQYFAKDKKYEVHRYTSRYLFLLYPFFSVSYSPKLNLRLCLLPWVWETKFNTLKNTNKTTLFW
jgi:hypothetical protein